MSASANHAAHAVESGRIARLEAFVSTMQSAQRRAQLHSVLLMAGWYPALQTLTPAELAAYQVWLMAQMRQPAERQVDG